MKNYANLRYKYEVAPTRSDIGSATMAQMFLQEKIAMHLSGRWLTPMYSKMAKFEWDIVPFPSGAVEDVSIPLDASGWAISKSSLHKEEALVFVKYLASKMSIKKLAKTGLIVPARNDVGFSNSDVYQLILEKAKPTPVSIDYNKVLDVMKIKNEALFNKIER